MIFKKKYKNHHAALRWVWRLLKSFFEESQYGKRKIMTHLKLNSLDVQELIKKHRKYREF